MWMCLWLCGYLPPVRVEEFDLSVVWWWWCSALFIYSCGSRLHVAVIRCHSICLRFHNMSVLSASCRTVWTASEFRSVKVNLVRSFWKTFQSCSGPNTSAMSSTAVWASTEEPTAGQRSTTRVSSCFLSYSLHFFTLTYFPFSFSVLHFFVFFYIFNDTHLHFCMRSRSNLSCNNLCVNSIPFSHFYEPDNELCLYFCSPPHQGQTASLLASHRSWSVYCCTLE